MKLEKIFSREEIDRRVKELAEDINEYYKGKEILVIGILKGAFIFMADLVRNLDLPLKIDFVVAKSYIGDQSSGKIEIRLEPYMNVENEDILLVEDIIDTGLTAKEIKKFLLEKGAKSVQICAIIDRKAENKAIIPDFLGFELEDRRFLVGYGLDLNEENRHLPDVYAVVPGD